MTATSLRTPPAVAPPLAAAVPRIPNNFQPLCAALETLMRFSKHALLAATCATSAALCLVAFAAPVSATNGMYLTGYGAEVVGRGGANLAISDRTLALNFNPAGIVQLQGRHTTVNLSVLAPKLEFENLANRPTDAKSRYFPLPAFAYVRAGQDSR